MNKSAMYHGVFKTYILWLPEKKIANFLYSMTNVHKTLLIGFNIKPGTYGHCRE